MKRPTYCTDDHLEYLNELDAAGTDMFEAIGMLEYDFGIALACAREIVLYWMSVKRKEAQL